jgi:hypothetical protein
MQKKKSRWKCTRADAKLTHQSIEQNPPLISFLHCLGGTAMAVVRAKIQKVHYMRTRDPHRLTFTNGRTVSKSLVSSCFIAIRASVSM